MALEERVARSEAERELEWDMLGWVWGYLVLCIYLVVFGTDEADVEVEIELWMWCGVQAYITLLLRFLMESTTARLHGVRRLPKRELCAI